MTGACVLWSKLASKTGKVWEYNFFGSYHGHCIADVDAAHAKQKLTNEVCNSEKIVNTGSQIAKILNELPNSNPILLPVNATKCDVKRWAGIKSFHRIVFHPNGMMEAYQTSMDDTPIQTRHVSQLIKGTNK